MYNFSFHTCLESSVSVLCLISSRNTVSISKCCGCHTNVGFYVVVVSRCHFSFVNQIFCQALGVKWTLVYISTIAKFFTAISGRFLGGYSFPQYSFIVARYDALYIIPTAVANLDGVSIKDFMKG